MATSVATLIGDIVGSRSNPDRAALHTLVSAVLERVNAGLDAHLVPVVPLRITVGDEYQGAFADVGAALAVSLRIRLQLHGAADVRQGIGWGSTTVLQDAPRVEDGPGWWAAREAIDAVGSLQRSGQPSLRTAYRGSGGAGPDPAAVNAALVVRDALLAAAGERSWGVLDGLLSGMPQNDIASTLQISPSAVSQRIRRDSLAALVEADRLLGGVR